MPNSFSRATLNVTTERLIGNNQKEVPMSQVKIFWDPQGVELNTLGDNEYLRATDGDTPFVAMSIRMLSIDTPEVHYPGTQSPSKQDFNLKQLADWIQAGKIPIQDDLAKYLHPKLATGKAGTLQEVQGAQAKAYFEKLLVEKLTRPDGTKRRVFLRTADLPFDQNGRLLAYVAPSYSAAELQKMTRQERATFNLLLVDSGWAASFPIFPSIPSYLDLVMLQTAGKDAFGKKRGAWADALTLAGYEFRMCVKLFQTTDKLTRGEKLAPAERSAWIERYCVDMTTREIYYPQDYYRVAPYNRIFVWPQDVNQAVAKMNLVPAN
jgi:endonuclease YncB( thermonuclease family)